LCESGRGDILFVRRPDEKDVAETSRVVGSVNLGISFSKTESVPISR
jgi:hypothetical protein